MLVFISLIFLKFAECYSWSGLPDPASNAVTTSYSFPNGLITFLVALGVIAALVLYTLLIIYIDRRNVKLYSSSGSAQGKKESTGFDKHTHSNPYVYGNEGKEESNSLQFDVVGVPVDFSSRSGQPLAGSTLTASFMPGKSEADISSLMDSVSFGVIPKVLAEPAPITELYREMERKEKIIDLSQLKRKKNRSEENENEEAESVSESDNGSVSNDGSESEASHHEDE